MRSKILLETWRPFCLVLKVLIDLGLDKDDRIW